MLLAAVTPAVPMVIPDFDATIPPGAEIIATIFGWGLWIVAILCVLGILVFAGRLALEDNRGGTVPWGRLIAIAFAAVLSGGAGTIVNTLV